MLPSLPCNLLILFLFYVFTFFLLPTSIYASVNIAQTGQTTSYISNDDGDNQTGSTWPAQRFNDNQDGTITDNLTGLMWLKDADCATENISGSITNQWSSALQFANDLNNDILIHRCNGYTKNHTDWRIPNVNEISSLMRAGLINRTIANWLNIPDNNSAGFSQTNLVDNPIWTSTTSAQDSNQVWVANLQIGGIELADKSNSDFSAHIFSAVRDTSNVTQKPIAPTLTTNQSTIFQNGDDGSWNKGEHAPTPRFITQDDDTIIDKLTGLIWLVNTTCATQIETNWYDAINSTLKNNLQEPALINNCGLTSSTETETNTTDQVLKQKLEWRVPSINELKSLIDYSKVNPALTPGHPFTINTDREFWSSTSSNGDNASLFAWSINFNNGKVSASTDKNILGYTWPVSGPIYFPDIMSDNTIIDFGQAFINTQTKTQKLTIKNNGRLPLTISSASTSNSIFYIRSNACVSTNNGSATETLLKPNETCDIDIEFSPTANQSYNDLLTIYSDALGSNEYNIQLSGSGANISGTVNEKGSIDCFIATAAYGSYLESEVVLLRTFRDDYLITNPMGQTLVKLYYDLSPPIANKIRENKILRFFTRALLTPIVYLIKYPVFASIFTLLLLLLLSKFIQRIALQPHKKFNTQTKSNL